MNMETKKIIEGIFDGTYEAGSISKVFQRKVNSKVEDFVERNIATEQTIVEFKEQDKKLEDWVVTLYKDGSEFVVKLEAKKGVIKGKVEMHFGKEKDAQDIYNEIDEPSDVMTIKDIATKKKSSKKIEVDIN